jgi:thiol-disulfide isomerase/thioredoxin
MLDLVNPTRRSLCWLAAVAVGLSAQAAAPSGDSAVLYLRDGDYLSGRLLDCDKPDVLRWQMRGAAQPFDMQAAALRAIYFPAPATPSTTDSGYMIELTDGDLLFGSLSGATPEQFEFDSPGLGRIHVARGEIRRITPTGEATSVEYRGPNGLSDWQASDEKLWREEAGRLISNSPHAKIQKQVSLPKSARVEVELAWDGAPEFEFTLSSGTSDEEMQEGFRFEVWEKSLVVLRALGEHADVAIIGKLDDREKRVQLEALVDQERGSLLVYSLDGNQLAEINLAPDFAAHGNALQWITFVNGRGELRLERLTVSRWGGKLPARIDADKPGLLKTDGTVLYGDVVGFDAATRQIALAGGENEEATEVAAAEVACIFPAPKANANDGRYRIGLHNGSRVSGDLVRVDDGTVYLQRRGFEEPLACSIANLRSIVSVGKGADTPVVGGRLGRLELDSVRLHGSLVAAPAVRTPAASPVTWQPRWSKTSSPLSSDASGRIVYRERPPKPKVDPRAERIRRLQQVQVQQRRPQRVGFWGAVANAFAGGGQHGPAPPRSKSAGTIFLVSGDRIPFESAQIDETGVRFKSPVVDATFIPHQAVKALELVPRWTGEALAEEKRQRLLTLPRMQKPNPPTHLVASTGGDFLRTRLISMTDDTLVIESRLEEKRIPRSRIACLIWLHRADSESPPQHADAAVDDRAKSPCVQAVRADGVRLTYSPEKCTGTELVGTSQLLGPCRVEVGAVDMFILNPTSELIANDDDFEDWKLTDAEDPRYLRDQGPPNGAGGSAGRASGLLGKPAPDVPLTLLAGGKFRLADHKGHVVVLDFWASWCGPCMQAMPQVDSVVAEFADRGVELVSVNLQEVPTAITSALERLKINPAVALDVDGALSEYYQVTAIPQTVVIDADGTVAQLFVGAGPDLSANLRKALEDSLKRSTP